MASLTSGQGFHVGKSFGSLVYPSQVQTYIKWSKTQSLKLCLPLFFFFFLNKKRSIPIKTSPADPRSCPAAGAEWHICWSHKPVCLPWKLPESEHTIWDQNKIFHYHFPGLSEMLESHLTQLCSRKQLHSARKFVHPLPWLTAKLSVCPGIGK